MFFLFNRTTLQVFVTYLTDALYVHPLWFYKHQQDNRVHSKLFVACQRWWFQWRFWFVPSIPRYLREEEEHKPDPWRNSIERNHIGYLKCIVYDKLLKPRQSFRITLYFLTSALQYNGRIQQANYVLPLWCSSAFFHQNALPEQADRIAKDIEHEASPK